MSAAKRPVLHAAAGVLAVAAIAVTGAFLTVSDRATAQGSAAPAAPAKADGSAELSTDFPICSSSDAQTNGQTPADLLRGAPTAGVTRVAATGTAAETPLSAPLASISPDSGSRQGAPAAVDGVRTYYVGIDEVEWNYAPKGIDALLGTPFTQTQQLYVYNEPDRIGAKNHKVIYREYTDDTFTTLKPRPPEWAHLGLLGPVFRGVVGETIRVVARNNSKQTYSLHPHGVFYKKYSEGAHYADGEAGRKGFVQPGETYTYTWPVPERAGPGPADGSSVVWPYHSHDHEGIDENTGLVGAIVITAKDKARPDGRPVDVDREFVTLYKIFDENMSALFEDNLLRYTEPGSVPVGANADSDGVISQGPLGQFVESNLKHSINGYLFANIPGLTMFEGEHVRWYVLGMGSTNDMHTAHWHGNTVLMTGRRMDTIGVFPATSVTATMIPDNPGTWMMHCHVIDHFQAGMTATYTVLPTPEDGSATLPTKAPAPASTDATAG